MPSGITTTIRIDQLLNAAMASLMAKRSAGAFATAIVPTPTVATRSLAGRGPMSAAAKRRIAAAQRKRWAEWRAKQEAPRNVKGPKRGKIGAEGLARIRAANRQRWARWRAAQKGQRKQTATRKF